MHVISIGILSVNGSFGYIKAGFLAICRKGLGAFFFFLLGTNNKEVLQNFCCSSQSPSEA